MRRYIYRGDRNTDRSFSGQVCRAVLKDDGKCIRGKNGNMLVEMNGRKMVVIARQLRKAKDDITDLQGNQSPD